MYRIGIKQGQWIIITNGEEIFEAAESLRRYSKPSDIRIRNPFGGPEENRVRKLSISLASFDAYCKSNGLEIRGCATSSEKARKMATPAAIGGIFGAVVGAGIFDWLASGSDFNIANLSYVFSHAKEDALEWDKL